MANVFLHMVTLTALLSRDFIPSLENVSYRLGVAVVYALLARELLTYV